MNLYLITQPSEFIVNVGLLRSRVLTGTLEFNEQRTAAGEPEDPIGVAGLPQDLQLGAFNPEMFPNEVDGVRLDLRL